MKDQVKDPLFNSSLEKKLTMERTENTILGERVLIFSAEQNQKIKSKEIKTKKEN